jgi:hypothetical protein
VRHACGGTVEAISEMISEMASLVWDRRAATAACLRRAMSAAEGWVATSYLCTRHRHPSMSRLTGHYQGSHQVMPPPCTRFTHTNQSDEPSIGSTLRRRGGSGRGGVGASVD